MLFKELTREEDLEKLRLDEYEEGFNSGERAGFSKCERAGFSKGERAGFSKGERTGAERGAKQEKIGIAKKLKALGLNMDAISESTGLTLEKIASL